MGRRSFLSPRTSLTALARSAWLPPLCSCTPSALPPLPRPHSIAAACPVWPSAYYASARPAETKWQGPHNALVLSAHLLPPCVPSGLIWLLVCPLASSVSLGAVWSRFPPCGPSGLLCLPVCSDQLGVIPDPDASSAPAKPSKFKEAADKVCSTPLEKVGEAYPKLDKRDAPYACLDATYQHALLTAGFGTKPFPSS